jgi:chromosome partitioning protein
MRGSGDPPLCTATEAVADLIKTAGLWGYEWVFIDTPPNLSAVVTDAIRAATMVVIPARLTLFDMVAVAETMNLCRRFGKPHALVINGVQPRPDNTEWPNVCEAREVLTQLNVPVWSGQITQRTNYSLALEEGKGAKEYDSNSEAAAEVAALWNAIEKSVKPIHGAYEGIASHNECHQHQMREPMRGILPGRLAMRRVGRQDQCAERGAGRSLAKHKGQIQQLRPARS